MGCSQSSPKREVHSDTGLPQKKKKNLKISNLTYHLKGLEKEQTKPKVSRRKEIIKTREEINKLEIKCSHTEASRTCVHMHTHTHTVTLWPPTQH